MWKFTGSIRKGCLLSHLIKLHVKRKKHAVLVVAITHWKCAPFILGLVLFLLCVSFSSYNLDSWIPAYGLSDLFMLLMKVWLLNFFIWLFLKFFHFMTGFLTKCKIVNNELSKMFGCTKCCSVFWDSEKLHTYWTQLWLEICVASRTHLAEVQTLRT